MILRARHLFFAWLTYGALQLALLGVPAASGQLAVGSRDARTQSTTQSVAIGKRLLPSDVSDRRAPSPFAPAAAIALALPAAAHESDIVASPRQAAAHEPPVLPPARAPPTRA
jgi:hypothetical protein